MLSQIERAKNDLSPAEEQVARWVLAHPRQAAKATLAEVARHCGTSEPTVIRFCRSIGLQGFRELGIRLTEAVSQPASYVHRAVSADDAAADAVAKVIDSSIQALIDLRSQLSGMPYDRGVQVLLGARQIAFIGLGASGHVATDAQHKFFRLGCPSSALTDTPTILQFAAIAEPGDVLVAISNSGRWSDVAHAMAVARNNGAQVIALTEPTSPIARNADLVFSCDRPEDASVFPPMSSRIAQLALLDALQVAFALALGPSAVARMRSTKAALAQASAQQAAEDAQA